MLPWFEVISQAPVFAAPELQSEAPLCTTNMYNVQLYTEYHRPGMAMCERKMYSIGFNLKVAPITTWNFDVSFADFLISWAYLCLENLFGQLQTSRKSKVEVNSSGSTPLTDVLCCIAAQI